MNIRRRGLAVVMAGFLMVLSLAACGSGGGSGESAGSPSAASSGSRYATVRADLRGDGDSTQVYLQAVETSTGVVVYEAIGADRYDENADAEEIQETAMRTALLVQLKAAMKALGWRQVSVGPEWYAVRFVAGPDARVAVTETPMPGAPSVATEPSGPQDAASAVTPEPPVTGDVGDLLALIGKPFDDPEIRQLVFGCGYGEDVDWAGNISCVYQGFELTMTSDLTVQSVTVFNQEEDGYSQYTGTLPFGLTWEDRYADVIAKLGQPQQVWGGNGLEVQLVYTVEGFTVEITTTATHNQPELLAVATIHWIHLAPS